MTDEEKDELLHGYGMNPYVGNTGLNMRLGIPALSLNDGPQGFRGKAGTTTQWMCSLAVGASWDPDVAF
eukprot:gene2413-16191_t